MMIVKFVVVHDLQKSINTAPSLQLQDVPLPHDENLTILTNDLLDIYSRKATKGFGSFNQDTGTYPFGTHLDIFLQHKTAVQFINFTQATMRLIESKIKTANLATGGYVLFLFYEQEGAEYMFISVLRQTKGCIIKPDLTIDSTQHIELEKLHIGCQVDIAPWKAGSEDPYITFIKGHSSLTTPQYFLEAIGCAEFTDSRKQTDEFIRAINDFADSKDLSAEDRREMRQKAHDYCVNEKCISISTVAAVIYGEDPEAFVEYVSSGAYKVGNNFSPFKRSLKRLREVSATGEGIRLSFPAEMIGKRIILEDREGVKMLSIKNPPRKLIEAYMDAD